MRAVAGVVLAAGGVLGMIAGGGSLVAGRILADTWAASDAAALAARQLEHASPRWVDGPGAGRAVRPTPIGTATPGADRPIGSATVTAVPTSAGDSGSLRPAATGTVEQARAAATPLLPPLRAASLARAGGGPRAGQADDAGAPGASAGAAAARTDDVPAADEPVQGSDVGEGLASAPSASADDVEVLEAELRFLDPPEPGAEARVSLHVKNRSDLPTSALHLGLPVRWLSGWKLVGAEPPLLDDRTDRSGLRTFVVPGLEPGEEATRELQLVATDDAVDPPDMRLSLADGSLVAMARPETVSPRPRPGPARRVEIPRLGLRAAVVQTAWEPPAFVVGQLRETANLSEGNTVLIGHLNGLAGDVFGQLDRLEPGDDVIAVSRGLAYRFVVSEIAVLPFDDSGPLQPTDEPRLTLMTCAGTWDPIGHDYSHRLWVVAEPPEVADESLARGIGPLARQRGQGVVATIQTPADLGPHPKELAASGPHGETVADADAASPVPGLAILEPRDGGSVASRVTVRGVRTDAETARGPVWLAVRARLDGSRWYVHHEPIAIAGDGGWQVTLELGGGGGIRHEIVVGPVRPETDAALRAHVHARPGAPLDALPRELERGAAVVVERR